MGYWKVLIPEGRTNIVTNPSCETATTGWAAVGAGSSVAQSSTYSYRGAYSLKIIAGAAADRGGAYTQTVATVTGAHSLSFAIWSAATSVKITVTDDGNSRHNATHALTANAWNVIEIENFTVTTTKSFVLSVLSTDASGPTFYVDAISLEVGAYCTTYIDGDLDGAYWNGTVHASTSTRSAQARNGGRVRDFYDDYGVMVVGMTGYGMPPLKTNVSEYSIMPGSLHQSTKVKSRPFTLIMEPASAGSLTTLHTRRDSLIEALKPDLVSPEQPVRLRYTGATNTVEIAAKYVGGLEGNLSGENGVSERFPVQFVADDPFWYGIGDNSGVLTVNQTVANADYLIKRVDGAWTAFSPTPNGRVEALAVAPDGSVYVGGAFTALGDANGNYIAKWNGSAWSSLGTGMDFNVSTFSVAADGSLYAGGTFTAAGGVANTPCIAKWNGSAWSALGTGITNGGVTSSTIDRTGNLYVGGSFTNIGDANGDRIIKWNGSAWSSLGSGALNNSVSALVTGADGSVYAGGTFTEMGGVANTAYIAKWNGSAWSALGTGMNGAVLALAVAPDGILYAGGSFTTAGGVTCNYLAKWNGAAWQPVGNNDVNGMVRNLGFYSGGLLYVSGAFTSGGAIWGSYIALWTGTTWISLPVLLPGACNIYAGALNGDDIYLGYNTAGTAYTSNLNASTNNAGSTAGYPVLTIKRSGGTSATLQWIKNETSQKLLNFNYALRDGETITLDLRPGQKSIGTDAVSEPGPYMRDPTGINRWKRKDIMGRTALPASDFATWNLAPGANNISIYVSEAGAPTVTTLIAWRPTYWSVDGAVS